MLNPLFKQLSYVPEQKILEGLGREMIQQYGLDVAYLPRKHVNIDPLFMEDPLSRFDRVHYIEMYMKNFVGYGQVADLMSKWGPLMNDKLTLSCMRSRFSEEFPDMVRPMEGDLIYISMTNALFEIKFVEHEDSFYQHGSLFYFDIVCERFNYSNETLATGIEEIDSIEDRYSTAVSSLNTMTTETNINLQLEDGSKIFTEQQLVTEGQNITLQNGQTLNTQSGGTVGSDQPDPFNPNVQNNYFKDAAAEIIDFSETNPFGKL